MIGKSLLDFKYAREVFQDKTRSFKHESLKQSEPHVTVRCYFKKEPTVKEMMHKSKCVRTSIKNIVDKKYSWVDLTSITKEDDYYVYEFKQWYQPQEKKLENEKDIMSNL